MVGTIRHSAAAWMVSSLALLVCLLVGCEKSQPVAQMGSEADASIAKDTTGVGASQDSTPEAPKLSDEPSQIDPGALNEQGQIILQSDSAQSSEPGIPTLAADAPEADDPAADDPAADDPAADDPAANDPAANEETSQANEKTAAAVDNSSAEYGNGNATDTESGTTDAEPTDSVPTVAVSSDDSTAGNAPSPAEQETTTSALQVSGVPTLAGRKKKAPVQLPTQKPVEANVTSEAERNQVLAADWPPPQAVIYVSGQQHGYIEPCGCTGLDQQKGGLIRRDTLLSELRDRGWDLIPVDVGNQVRRIGRQPEIKFQTTVEAFKLMDYKAATLGVDDLKLSSIELIQSAGSDELNPGAFVSANVTIIDPSFFPAFRIVEAGERKIGITGILGKEHQAEIRSDSVEIADPVASLKPVLTQLQEQGCDFFVLLAHASLDESAEIARQVPGFDLVVTAGGYGEPTLLPEKIEDSSAVMVQVGTKGMYGGIVGLYDDEETPIRYQKIAISSQFSDSDRMLEQFAKYQSKLESAGLSGLGITPVAHPTARQFVGSEVCGDCHTTAYEIWEDSPHIHATDSIIAANNDRGGIARHHDPECISCHATGWNPQKYYPYETGFLNPDQTEHLVGSGCENCHGPGKAHVDAEYGDIEVDNDMLLELRQQLVLKLEDARDKCLECHDLDNSPGFHDEGAWDEYWEQVKHYGKD